VRFLHPCGRRYAQRIYVHVTMYFSLLLATEKRAMRKSKAAAREGSDSLRSLENAGEEAREEINHPRCLGDVVRSPPDGDFLGTL